MHVYCLYTADPSAVRLYGSARAAVRALCSLTGIDPTDSLYRHVRAGIALHVDGIAILPLAVDRRN